MNICEQCHHMFIKLSGDDMQRHREAPSSEASVFLNYYHQHWALLLRKTELKIESQFVPSRCDSRSLAKFDNATRIATNLAARFHRKKTGSYGSCRTNTNGSESHPVVLHVPQKDEPNRLKCGRITQCRLKAIVYWQIKINQMTMERSEL